MNAEMRECWCFGGGSLKARYWILKMEWTNGSFVGKLAAHMVIVSLIEKSRDEKSVQVSVKVNPSISLAGCKIYAL